MSKNKRHTPGGMGVNLEEDWGLAGVTDVVKTPTPEKQKTFAEITHDTDMGQKVRVERDAKLTGDIAKEAGSNLLTIGQFLAESDHSIKHCKYLGSAAVHVYQSEMLGEVFFFTQVNTLCNMNEMIASNAMSELNKRGMEYYSRRIPKKRSGW